MSNPVPPAEDALHTHASLRVVYSFSGGSDAAGPAYSLTAVGGELYGVSQSGGGTGCKTYRTAGCGTIYKVDASGEERVLYAFKGGADGAFPSGPLSYLNGELYGVTVSGGSGCTQYHGCGTIFEVSLSGSERVLFRFGGGLNPAFPAGRLAYANGAFYGEADGNDPVSIRNCQAHKAHRCGIIFKVTPAGHVSAFYMFAPKDGGKYPLGGLLYYRGNLYGTGLNSLFRISLSGTETILHADRRGGGAEGGVIAFDGKLYGAGQGGKYDCASGGPSSSGSAPCGAIYKYELSGKETTLYGFNGGSGGQDPSRLIAVGSTFYGTAGYGGIEGQACSSDPYAPPGCGTVFALTPNGAHKTLYQFHGSDGEYPNALIDVGGTLYGSAYSGGSDGHGSVFAITL